MATWQVLLIVAGIVAVGCIAGVGIGKMLVRRSQPRFHPVLNAKQRVAFFSCIAAGIGCILIGLYLDKPAEGELTSEMEGGMPGIDGGGAMIPDGGVIMEREAMAEEPVGGKILDEEILDAPQTDGEAPDDAGESAAEGGEESAVG